MDTFKHHREIEIMISTMLKGKPQEGFNWGKFHSSFKPITVTPYQMAQLIWQGYSFTPVYQGGRRLEKNFKTAWHMAFDFDSEGASLDHLMNDGSLAWMFCSFAYSTPSSTKDHPKSRVVFIFDFSIDSPERFREVYQALAWSFALEGAYTDPQCKDPLRLYFGSPQCEIRGNWACLTQAAIDVIVKSYKDKNPDPIKTYTPQTAKPDSVPNEIINQMIERVLDKIRYAPDSERHLNRRNISRAMGGYVAAGYLDKATALSMLIEAALSNTRTPDKAQKEVEQGLDFGMGDPLYIEYTPVESLGVLLS